MNELKKFVESINDKELSHFLTKNESSIKIETKAEKVVCDYTWLEKIEESIEALDNIMRNPRKFIVSEEEIVPIAKAKKITLESVRHLAQHTNLIQDIAEDGTITPISILNVNKEETYDLYENRFINSLLKNVYVFINNQKKEFAGESFSKCKKKITYQGETKLKNEKVKINVSLESNYFENLVKQDPSGLSVTERVDRVQMIFSDFMKTPWIKELANALPVRSPIRKTNVILKEQNFKKALELWEFIEKQQVVKPAITNEDSVIDDNHDLEDLFDFTYFIDYDIMNKLVDKEFVKVPKNELINRMYIRRLIEEFLNDNGDLDEKGFKALLEKEFKRVKKLQREKDKEILNKIKFNFKQFDRNMERICKILD